MTLPSTTALLTRYRESDLDEERAAIAQELLERAPSEHAAMEGVLEVLNTEKDAGVRLQIVQYLHKMRSPSAIRALTKGMVDPDPLVRAHSAEAIADFDDARLLARSLGTLFDALPDPATRGAAVRAIKTVTGRTPDKISVSERERVRLGEHPQTIWPGHFASIPPSANVE
jgi:HEAT repeat protein